MSDWISTNEQQPEIGQACWLLLDYDRTAVGIYLGNSFLSGPSEVSAAHWMPFSIESKE